MQQVRHGQQMSVCTVAMPTAQAAVEGGDDLDAVLDRELARCSSEASEGGMQVLLDHNQTHIPSPGTDGDEDPLDSNDLAELESYTALQEALRRRHQQCEHFLQELESHAHMQPATQAVQVGYAFMPAVAPNLQGARPVGNSASGSAVFSSAQSFQHAAAEVQNLLAATASSPCTAAGHEQEFKQTGTTAGDSAADVINCNVTVDDHIVGHEYAALADQLVQERRASRLLRAAAECEHTACKQQQRKEQQKQANEQHALMQASADAASQQLVQDHAAVLAALDAAQTAAQQGLQLLQEQQAMERAHLREQQVLLQQRFAEQVAAVAVREQSAQEQRNQVQMQLAHELWQQAAARRISCAWRQYHGSDTWRMRIDAVVGLQTAVRAWLARRNYKRSCQQHMLIEQLHVAAGCGDAEQLQAAMQQASALGLDKAEVETKITTFQHRSQQVLAALQQASIHGGAVSFRQAVQAAARIPHLAAHIQAAEVAHRDRVVAAGTALQAAAQDMPMQEVVKAADSALQLGCDATMVTDMLGAARQRDAAVQSSLMTLASQVPYRAGEFAALATKASKLGLQGDVAAAQTVLNQRRRQLAAQLPAAMSKLSYEESQGLLYEAQELGMVHEAAHLGHQLAERQQSAARRLQQVAACSTPDHLQIVLQQSKQHGVSMAVQHEALATITARQQQAALAVMQTASGGTLHAYMRARRVALQCGACDCVAAAEAALQARQQRTCIQLAAAVQQLQAQLQGLSHSIVADLATCLHTALDLGPLDAPICTMHRTDQEQDALSTTIAHKATLMPEASINSTMAAGTQHVPEQGSSSQQAADVLSASHSLQGTYEGTLDCVKPLPAAVMSIITLHTTANSALPCIQSLWQKLQEATWLGLHPHASLALGGLALTQHVRHAQGSHVAAQLTTRLTYNGMASACAAWRGADMDASLPCFTTGVGTGRAPSQQLEVGNSHVYILNADGQPTWVFECARALHSTTMTTRSAWQRATGSSPSTPMRDEDAVSQAVAQARSSSSSSGTGTGSWVWPPACTQPAATHSWQLPCASNTPCNVRSSPVDNTQDGAHVQAVNTHAKSSQHSANALSMSMLSTLVGHGNKLKQITHLDLGLEQLTSVSGLDIWCPALRVLRLDNNQLSHLQGLQHLACLTELSVKHNQLTVLSSGSLSSSLQVLHLDCNQLIQLRDGLQQLSGLHTLTAADNMLSRLGLAEPASSPATSMPSWPSICCPHLSVVEVAGNRLTSLQELHAHCLLVRLDVRRNKLTNLDGLQACTLLQHINAAHNSIHTWPAGVVGHLHHLQHLNLSNNHITSWGPSGSVYNSRTGLQQGAGLGSVATDMKQGHKTEQNLQHSNDRAWQQELVLPVSLEVLLLQDNQLPNLCAAIVGPRLTLLDISFNCITSCDQLAALTPLVQLTCLKVHDNPVASLPTYLPTLHAFLPQLQELDLQPLSPQQQLQHLAGAALQSSSLAVAHARSMSMQVCSFTIGAVWAAAAACRGSLALPDGSSPQERADEGITDQLAARQRMRAFQYWMHQCSQFRNMRAADGLYGSCSTCSAALSQLDMLYSIVDEHAADQHKTRALQCRSGQHAPAAVVAGPVAPMACCLQTVQSNTLPAVAVHMRADHNVQLPSHVVTPTHSGVQPLCSTAVMSVCVGGEEAVLWNSYKQQHLQAATVMGSQHIQSLVRSLAGCANCVQPTSPHHQHASPHETSATLSAAAGGDYFTRRVQALTAAVVRIQAAARGWRARKLVQLCHQAVVLLQAAWRAFVVRKTFSQLAVWQRQGAAQAVAHAGAQEQSCKPVMVQQQQQAQAAVAIQSAARGWLVRRRMHAALQAARLHADDDDDAGDAEQMEAAKGFLADIELILKREQLQSDQSSPLPAVVAPARAGPACQPNAVPQPCSSAAVAVQLAVPSAQLLTTAPALAKVFAAKIATTQAFPHGGASLAGIGHMVIKSAWDASTCGPPNRTAMRALQQDYQQHNPAVLLPPLHHDPTMSCGPTSVMLWDGTAGAAATSVYEEPNSPSDCQSQAASCSTTQLSTGVTFTNAAAAAARRSRHMEQLEALMAEWGFQDIATAEAYWRRQQHATYGATRRKLQDRYKDPALRLRKLQEQVDQRVMLRPEQLQRTPLHGPVVQLRIGALQGLDSSTRNGKHGSHEQVENQSVRGDGLKNGDAGVAELNAEHANIFVGAVNAVAKASGQMQGRCTSSADAALSRSDAHQARCTRVQNAANVTAAQQAGSLLQQPAGGPPLRAIGQQQSKLLVADSIPASTPAV